MQETCKTSANLQIGQHPRIPPDRKTEEHHTHTPAQVGFEGNREAELDGVFREPGAFDLHWLFGPPFRGGGVGV